MAESAHLLIVDDDPRICRLLSHYLESEGYRVSTAGDAAGMRQQIEKDQPDLVILDLMLPDADGITLAGELRKKYNLGIIILTAKVDQIETIIGLEVGADDYIKKPVDKRELLARIHSVLRRITDNNTNSRENNDNNDSKRMLQFDGWQMDLAAYKLTSPSGERIHLTANEFRLLTIFVQNAERVLNRDQILEKLSSREWQPDDRSVDVLIGKLRKKIEDDPSQQSLICTIRNAGYQFRAKVT